MPVQAAEGARDDGARAARAARADMAEDGVALVVFEAEVVDLFVVLSVRCVNKGMLREKIWWEHLLLGWRTSFIFAL